MQEIGSIETERVAQGQISSLPATPSQLPTAICRNKGLSNAEILHDTESRPGLPPASLEPHFSVQVLAELWRLDESTVRRIFEAAPGVLRLGSDTRRSGKRDYFTLRIPASVAEREYQRRVVVSSEPRADNTIEPEDRNHGDVRE